MTGEIRRMTGGGADVVFEAAGKNQAFAEAFRLARKGGTVVELGVAADQGEVTPSRVGPRTGDGA